MKTCTKCKQTKELKEFHKYRYSLDGYNTRCKLCCKEAYEKSMLAKMGREKRPEPKSYQDYLNKAKQKDPKTYGCYEYNPRTKGSELKTPKYTTYAKQKAKEEYKQENYGLSMFNRRIRQKA